jgi:two-component system chemotaxis response regulator CheB
VSPRRHAARAPRVLLVDDSEASRSALERILEGVAVVVGAARDGEEALRDVLRLEPDLVFLDLQMPRMDGFTLLRLLMARRPTPVVVVSSLSHRADVFKALELGALDFVAKPDGGAPLEAIAGAIREKCGLVRALRPRNLGATAPRPVRTGPSAAVAPPPRIVAIGASAGGPQAILRLLSGLPRELAVGFLVAQHMPEKFTAAFAERISRCSPFSAQEAHAGDLVAEGRVLVAPGGHHLELRRAVDGSLEAAVVPADPAPVRRGPAPSVDRLFASVAELAGPRACGVVLTGMGQDGRDGVRALRARGAVTIAESEETAVVYGMPQAAAESGALDELLPLERIGERLVRFAGGT